MIDVVAAPVSNVGRWLVVRSFLSSFAGDLSARIAVFATTFVAVRSLSTLEFGQFIGLSATILLAASLWDCGVTSLLTREFAAGHLSLHGAITQTGAMRLKTLPLWLAGFMFGAAIINRAHTLSLDALLGFGGASLLFASNAILLAVLRGRLQFGSAGVVFSLGRWCTTVLSALTLPAVHVAAGRLTTFALALLAGEALTFGLAVGLVRWRYARLTTFEPNVQYLLTLRAALPFAANSILSTLYNRFDVVIVAALTTATQLALYAPASRIQDALYLIPGSVQMIALPLVARTWGGNRGTTDVQQMTSRLILGGLGLCIPITIVFSLFTPAILRFVFGPEYIGATAATRILIWSLPFGAIGAPLLAALAGSGHAGETTKIFGLAFGIALLMHCSLDWWWGATGGAVASLSVYPVTMFFAFVLARRAGVLTTKTSIPVTDRRSKVLQ